MRNLLEQHGVCTEEAGIAEIVGFKIFFGGAGRGGGACLESWVHAAVATYFLSAFYFKTSSDSPEFHDYSYIFYLFLDWSFKLLNCEGVLGRTS